MKKVVTVLNFALNVFEIVSTSKQKVNICNQKEFTPLVTINLDPSPFK